MATTGLDMVVRLSARSSIGIRATCHGDAACPGRTMTEKANLTMTGINDFAFSIMSSKQQ
jgi:hypothetical protein